jgi:hypothetical protein
VAAEPRGVLVDGLAVDAAAVDAAAVDAAAVDAAAVDAGGEGAPQGSVVVVVVVGEQVRGAVPVESAEAAHVWLRLLVVVGVFAEEGLRLQVRPGAAE